MKRYHLLDCSNMNLKHVPVRKAKDTRTRILSFRQNNIKAANELDVIRAYQRLMCIDLRKNPSRYHAALSHFCHEALTRAS